MRKDKRLVNQITAMLLSGMLVVGLIPGAVLASDIQAGFGQTSETVDEEVVEMPSEDVTEDVSKEEGMGTEEVSTEEYSEDVITKKVKAVSSYTVTLDANGGYFVNEWDDAMGETVETTNILTRAIPVGGVVSTFPVREQDNTTITFLGWSLERDGELVSQGDEEYMPVDNCVLYAVWQADEIVAESEEASWGETDSSDAQDIEFVDEGTDQADSSQEFEDTGVVEETEAETENSDSVEGAGTGSVKPMTEEETEKIIEDTEVAGDTENAQETEETEIIEESEAVQENEETDVAVTSDTEQEVVATDLAEEPETAQKFEDTEVVNETEEGNVEESTTSDSYNVLETEVENLMTDQQDFGSDQEAVYTDEEENTSEDISDMTLSEEETQPELIESTEEEETVREDATNGVVASGSCGDNLTWMLDEDGTLRISGTGEMYDYESYYDDDELDYVCNTPWYKHINRLQAIYIGEGVESIGKDAFEDCNAIKSITMPSSLKSIGNGAFIHCDSLTDVAIPDSVNHIGLAAFKLSGIRSIALPKKLKSIEEEVFMQSELESIVLPEELLSIGERAFYCSNLKSISIPSTVTNIGVSAFSDCPLESIVIPPGTKQIESSVFYCCKELKSIIIPSNIERIGYSAFENCMSLSEIHFIGNAPVVDNDYDAPFNGVNATAYYPANDPTWTENVRQNYGGNITWVPWDGTDPIVTPDPSSFSISIGTPENSAVVIDDDGQLSTVAYYGFSNKDTALNEAKNIKWTCSDASAVEIYDPVYDLETNDVRIALSLRGKKPGTYTITGTAPDGRKASADVVVEPKMVALSDKKEITDKTDVEMLQVTLSSPDKAYLTSFLNGITCDIKDDYGAIGGAEGKRVEISDDGKTGKLIYSLSPVYGGNAEFAFTSPGGQKTTETIYSIKNLYPGGALYEKNTVVYYQENDLKRIHFDYSLDDCLSSSSLEYSPKLAYMLISLATSAYQGENTFTLLKSSGDMFPNDPLAITESLRNLGFSAEKGDIIENNYYEDAFDPNYKENSTAFSIATKKNSDGEDILVVVIRGSYGGFGNDGFFHLNWEKWASDWRGNTNFHNYDTGLHEGFNIAASEIIDEISSFLSQKNLNKNTVKFVVTGHSRGAAVANLVSKKLIDSGVSREKVYDYNFACPDSGRDYDHMWNINNKYGSIFNINNVKDVVGVIPGNFFNFNLNTTTAVLNLFSGNQTHGVLFWGKYGNTFFFSENWETVEDTVIGNPGVEHQPTYYLEYLSKMSSVQSFKSWTEARAILAANGVKEHFAKFGKIIGVFCPVDVTVYDAKGNILAQIVDGEQTYFGDSFGNIIILTAADQNLIYLKDDKYNIVLRGTDSGSLSYLVSDTISEDNSSVLFNNINLQEGKRFVTSLEQEQEINDVKLLVTNENGLPVKNVLIDGTEEDISNDIVDYYLSEGCYISKKLITSELSSNIEIELNESSFAIQEGDVLTLDATIKTDKERVKGQNEYIGYFAYYANRQWNQLASWNIEGGTTKYVLKLKKDTWDKYGDVMFTVSVFPKNSFTQGSALVDKVFLVNISRKEEEHETVEETIVDSGTCGNSLTWSLSKEGTLVISGKGKMSNWTYESPSPWNKYASEILNVVIENGVTSIGNYAFYNCRKLKSVSFGETVAEIGECAFMMTYELHKVAIPDSVKTIKKSAFSCSWIEELSLGNSVERIEDDAFGGNFALTEVVFPESISYLGKDIFEGADFKDIYYCGEAPEMEFCVFNLINNEEDVTVYIPVWSESWNNEIKRNLCLKTVTWKTWNPGNKKTISSATVNLDENTFIFTGKAIQPSISVSNSGMLLKNKTDYEISYSNNTNAGTAKVSVKGTGTYYGTVTKTFKINKAAQSITAKAAASRIAVGKTTTVSITGNKGSKSFKSSDTTIATVDKSTGKVTAKKVGTVKITATSAATANYNAASKTVTIKVVPAATASLTAANQATGIKLTWKKVTGANGYKIYRGKTLIKTITSGSTVTFVDKKANTNGTKYVYKLVAKASTGDSTLSKTRGIYRVTRPAISSLKNSASKKMTVKWGKNAKANGYQIQYSKSKTFASGNKTATAAGASTVSKVITSLTKGKTYYVRVRAYKTVNNVKFFSSWSVVKSVKISK